ncbi:MAG: ATP-binding protein, partial [Solirubrobacterales bacterium]|nr:ATP-binding protein [Solirubrobacterales bacterium]MBV9919037.1 ATP-binding protein [Solirubrobacterales bacterium]
LGHLAIDKGKTVARHTLETLAQLLRRHRADDSVGKAIGKLIRADLVVIDLCRHRDYAETNLSLVVNIQDPRRFRAVASAGLSA